jgi:predicted amidophosphoribosyltransferase
LAGCFCDKCGAALEENDIFCRECGERADKHAAAEAEEAVPSPVAVIAEEAEPIEEADEPPGFCAPAEEAAFCRNCGAPLEKSGSFCWECGERIGEAVAVEDEDDEPAGEPSGLPPLAAVTGRSANAGAHEWAGDAAEQAEPAGEALICGNCGAPLAKEDVLCPACGTWVVSPVNKKTEEYPEFDEIHLSERICGNCGAFLREGDIFCPACGVRAVFRDEPAVLPEEIDEPDEPADPRPPASAEEDEAMEGGAEDVEPVPHPSRVRQKKRSVLGEAAVFPLAGVLAVLIVIACFHLLPNLQQTRTDEGARSQPESQRAEETAGAADEAVFAPSADQPEPAEVSSLGEGEFEPRPGDSEEYDYLVLSGDLPPMFGVSGEIAEDYAGPGPEIELGAEFEVIISPDAAASIDAEQ